MRSCSPVLIPHMHVGTVVPNSWDPEAPSWCLVGTYDLMFLTREILQPHHDTSQAYTIWCSSPVRSCSPTLIPRRHVRSGVPNPCDPAAPSWYLVGTYDLIFLNRRILQPHPATSQACPIWCSLLERACSPVLIPCRHVRSGVPDLWNPTASSWYLVGILDLLFQTIEILQPRPDTL